MLLKKCAMAILIALTVTTVSYSADPIKLIFTDQQFEGQWMRKVGLRFVELAEEKSNGRIKMDLKLGGVLGDYMALAEQTSMGSIDLVCSAPPSDLDPDIDILWLGFLERSLADAQMLWDKDGDLFNMVDQIFAKSNLKLLHLSTDGWLGILVRKNANIFDKINTIPGDAKGTKARIPPSRLMQARISSYGFNAIPIPFSECYTGLQLGTFDFKCGTVVDELNVFGDVSEGFIHTHEALEKVCILMNLDKFNTLPEDLQNALTAAGEQSQKESFREIEAFTKSQEQAAIDKFGVKIKTLSPDSLANLYQVGQKAEWTAAEKIFGKEKMDIVRTAVAKLE
ncbi:TRAP transporter substrate-binding protein DctP [Desulfotignum phosphitoxidans]|jgi:TRAP-type C4-dicarboxylate transport system substrate-binding protein|uniref:TRAP-type C4-dicarboxylate transporter, periplasmatic component DctP n=1 Tax=Desulfotignum phosphitoxidans DSM 13687 TaxID=1286635 RepID=S0G109_9BACT|nr:TRAP transporter substrate-binding protein DctP [Desulfotignum phosphitoxidans]EMS77366.1 TRAP-type C4-dicarboxylate transporter, periplasmatic component DctP [Desulfotignum phosphitoxidans DSM 13687]